MPIGLDGGRRFSDTYKDEVFWIWYNNQKPSASALYNLVPEHLGNKPSRIALYNWVKDTFPAKAEPLDNAVQMEMQARLIKSKVQMLERHTQISERMQEIGFNVLEENEEEISIANAVRLVIEGVRIERESRGIPEMLGKLAEMSDEKLISTIENMVTKSPLEIEAINDDE